MNTKTKSLSISTILSAALFLILSASQASVETTQAPDGVTVTRIKVNGQSADTFLVDGDTNTNGGLNASKDQVANTTALDFSYATPDATDPDLVILIQGMGEIPNSGFTITSTSAHLLVTTPFRVNRCVVNIVTAEFTCADIAPITFDLTWVKNSLGSVYEKTKRRETFGPVTTKFQGEFINKTATVNGTWTGHTGMDLIGHLFDGQSNTIIREITMEASE